MLAVQLHYLRAPVHFGSSRNRGDLADFRRDDTLARWHYAKPYLFPESGAGGTIPSIAGFRTRDGACFAGSRR